MRPRITSLAKSLRQWTIVNQLFDRASERRCVAGLHQKSSFVFDDHLGNAADVGRDDWQTRRHGFHDDCRKIVYPALGIDHAWQHKNARSGETLPNFALRFSTGQCSAILQIQLLDLRA